MWWMRDQLMAHTKAVGDVFNSASMRNSMKRSGRACDQPGKFKSEISTFRLSRRYGRLLMICHGACRDLNKIKSMIGLTPHY